MKIRYDAEADALSIIFRKTTVTTRHLAEGIAAAPTAVREESHRRFGRRE